MSHTLGRSDGAMVDHCLAITTYFAVHVSVSQPPYLRTTTMEDESCYEFSIQLVRQ